MKLEKASNKLHQYKYAKIDSYYFCLNQNACTLAWVLCFKRDDLNSIYTPWLPKKTPNKKLGYLRFWYRHFISNLLLLYKFLKKRRILLKSNTLVELPVYGQVCLRVHRGYKIFNFRSGLVLKYYDSDVNIESIKSEVDRLKKVSTISFAPSIRRFDLGAGWFEEDYVGCTIDVSQRSLDSVTFLSRFYNDIVPCLNHLVSFKQPLKRRSLEYIEEIIDNLKPGKSFWSHLDRKNANKVRNLLHSVYGQLKNMGNYPVLLIFSHGDIVPANILQTRVGIRIVDWEGATYRSLLFDFYSYFFYRAACKQLPIYQLASEIKEALPTLLQRLPLRHLDTTKNILALKNTYRWIYYVETIQRLVERNMTDKKLDIMDFLSRYIEAFNRYEDLVHDTLQTKTLKAVSQM